jgi:CDP-glucose 4,6-dehydratase
MAAQALVRESYKDPLTTFETNVNGTLNILKACQEIPSIKAILAVTTDKVYKNTKKITGHIENDELGGADPYSASKAMADIAVQSWISSFPGDSPIGICRAGNVIGGGDISMDRLIPDLIDAYSTGRTPTLRYPNAIRPWQHVLDCLNGYLMLVDSLLVGKSVGPWNFGPSKNELRTVEDVTNAVGKIWGVAKNWELDSGLHPEETSTLVLDSQKARSELGWENKLDFAQSLEWTTNWYKDVHTGESPLQRLAKDIDVYEEI